MKGANAQATSKLEVNLQFRAHERNPCKIRFRAGIGTYLVDGDRLRQGPAEFGFVA